MPPPPSVSRLTSPSGPSFAVLMRASWLAATLACGGLAVGSFPGFHWLQRDAEARREGREARGMSAYRGVRIVDFSQGVAGPMAAMLLGDFEAEVVKVEPPGGDRLKDHPG